METNARVYRRSELYEQVWAEPLRKLAPRYGVSDVALAKMCRRLGIPLPGVGHWTKIACGHEIEPPPLPPATADQPEEVVVEPPAERVVSVPAAVAEPLPVVRVSDHLRDPHPLVAWTKTLTSEAERDNNGRYAKDNDGRYCVRRRGGLDALVGRANFGRALRIMDAIFKHLERNGCKIGVEKERPFSTYAVIEGQHVAFQLREGVIRTKRPATYKDPSPYPSFDSEPNGVFTLEIKEYLDGLRKVWSDGKEKRIEDQLGSFVVGLERAGTCLREKHERFLEAERERAIERMRREEQEARRREEKQKIDELLEELASWRKSEALRAYVEAARAAALAKHGSIDDGSELDEWMKWALGVADRLDPLRDLKSDNGEEMRDSEQL